ncbi:MAG: hypothetical protein ABF379_11515 [Akkermansiaceae bacterium]
MKWKNVTRNELHKRVWEKPASQLKNEFGVSDVAIAKACKRLEIPKPPRGYWARLAAGQKPPITPLPVMSKGLQLQVEQERIQDIQSEAEAPCKEYTKLGKVTLPIGKRGLHPFARELRTALRELKPDDYHKNRLHLGDSLKLPVTTISEAKIPTMIKCFNAILAALESRNVLYKAARRRNDQPAFYFGKDRVSLLIEEPTTYVHRPLTPKEQYLPQWKQSEIRTKPGGLLTFLLILGESYSIRRIEIRQTDKKLLEQAVAEVIESIWGYFAKEQQSRIEERIQREKDRIAYEARIKREAIEVHEQKLEEIARQREQNLTWAAQWWNIENTTAAFIRACERHWLTEQDELSGEQQVWLKWARQFIKTLPTAEFSYPDPTTDGAFAPESVEQGGPYPTIRYIPKPPSIPTARSSDLHEDSQQPHPPQQKPYPFWLKHPH